MLFEGPMIVKQLAVATPWVRQIHIDYRTVLPSAPKPVLLILHGFKGFKDWGFFPWVSEQFAQRGYNVLTVNFSGCGVIPGQDTFGDPDGFAENTISREIDEVALLMNELQSGSLATAVNEQGSWDGKVCVLGHSRGGSVALLSGRHVQGFHKVASWAAPASFLRFTDRQIAHWQDIGYLEMQNSRTGELLRMNESYLRDIQTNSDKLNIPLAVAHAQQPTLLVHGTEDLTVKIAELHKLTQRAHPATVHSVEIAQTGHTFGAVHPFQGPTPALSQAFEHTFTFFEGM